MANETRRNLGAPRMEGEAAGRANARRTGSRKARAAPASSRRARSSVAASSTSAPARCSWTSATRARARSRSRSSTAHGILPKVGDEIEVYLEAKEDSEGLIVLSKDKADKIKVWDAITAVLRQRHAGRGHGWSRSSRAASPSTWASSAFLPGSQVDLRPVKNLAAMLGPDDPAPRSSSSTGAGATSSCRAASVLEEEREEKKKHTLECSPRAWSSRAP